MYKSSMCRICLVEDIRTYCVHNTNLQETYERLTGLPFVTIDRRPLQVCYICCARLRSCYRLQSICLESEEYFTEMLENNQLKPTISQNTNSLKIVHPVISWCNVAISPEDVPVDIIIDDDDDDDDVIFCDNNHNLDVKVDVKVEAVEGNIENEAMKTTSPNDNTSQHESTLANNNIITEITNITKLKISSDINTFGTNIVESSSTKLIESNNGSTIDVTTQNIRNNTSSFDVNTVDDDLPRIISIDYERPNCSSSQDINTVKNNIIEQVDRIEYIASNKSLRLNISTVDENVKPQEINIECTKPKNSSNLEMQIVKDNVIPEVINIEHIGANIIPSSDVNATKDDIHEAISNKHTETNNTLFEDNTEEHNKESAIQSKSNIAATFDVGTVENNVDQEMGVEYSISHNTLRVGNVDTFDHIEQEMVIDNNELDDYQEGNEYAVPSDVFRCDDINAVEGNFIGQEVIIEYTESTDIDTFNVNTADGNIINQDEEKEHMVANNARLNDSTENVISQGITVEHTISNNTDVLHTIDNNVTENEVAINFTEPKDDPKPDSINLNQVISNECVRPKPNSRIDNKIIKDSVKKINLPVNNSEVREAEEKKEEKYHIDSESNNTHDSHNKRKCLRSNRLLKDVFLKDVMVVLHKTELVGVMKSNENINFEGENKEIGAKDHRRRRSSRKRKSAVLKETPETANTQKREKQVRFAPTKRDYEALDKRLKVGIDKKPFICDVCHKCFALKHHLIEHNRKHTGEKPFKCDICERRFHYQNVLNNHIASHSNLRPHKCNLCGKCYSLKVNLLRHIRVHTCEKPYKCHICGKSFGYKQHLTTHIRIHTGERPFPCDLCPKRFNQRNNLNAHIRSVHPDAKPSS